MPLQVNVPQLAKISFPLTSQPTKPSCRNQEMEIAFEMQLIRSRDRYDAPSPDSPHRHQHVEVIWIKRGNGYLEIEDISGKLYREMISGYLLRLEIIKRYTCIFLIYLARQLEVSLPVANQSNDTCLAKKFITLVEKKCISCKMVKEYARELAVSPNYLNEVVKRMSGYSARHHIRQRIVLEAKRQATCQSTSMKEIAYHLGFEDMAHFSKFSKTVYGKNFTDFRKELFC